MAEQHELDPNALLADYEVADDPLPTPPMRPVAASHVALLSLSDGKEHTEEVMAPTVTSSRRWKALLFTSFQILPTVLVAGIIVSLFLVLLSGTMLVDGDMKHGGMLLSRIAVVKFQGLVESPPSPSQSPDAGSTTTPYVVTLLWFMNSFGWEYPKSHDWESSTGLSYNIAGFVQQEQLRLPYHLFDAARRLNAGGCADRYSRDPGQCSSPFFQQFRLHGEPGTVDWSRQVFSAALPLAMHYLAFVVCFSALVTDMRLLLGKGSPPAFFRRVVAPGREAEEEEVEARVRGVRRDRMLLYAAVAASVVLALGSLAGVGLRLVVLLRALPESRRMDPRLGSGFVGLAAGCGVAAVVSFGLAYLQHWHGMRTNSWVLPIKEKEDS